MKKEYTQPTMNVVMILQQTQLLSGSVTGLGSNLNNDEDETNDIGYGGGGHGAAHSRGHNGWDDDDE